jgi:hypothetical protein
MSIFGSIVNLGKSIVSGVGKLISGVVSFATSIVSSLIVSKPKVPDLGNQGIDNASGGVGNRQQIPPASNNKLPVAYGTAWVGGTITDLSITSNNQTMYYVLALSEVTNTNGSGTADEFTFGNVYWGGKRCNFDGTDLTKVISLTDESTGAVDTAVSGNLYMYFYKNGSNAPVNTSLSAITVMSDSNLIYKWDSTKLMTNTVFAIVKINYNSAASITSIQQTKFQITNARSNPADCLSDYFQSVRYGAAIPSAQIDTTSLSDLSAYCNQSMTYTTYTGGTSTLTRFRFDGVLDTAKSIQSNMQIMSDCCDCLIRYNEITAKWGVIVQKPSYTVAMDINDSNIVSAIKITPIETSATYNIAEVYYADNVNQDSFSSVTFDLATIAPSLLYQNEPVNKQNVTLNLVNNDVRAQYLATRFLKSCREDLQVQASIMFVGLQLEAGDIVTMTLAKYGWAAKLFRIAQVKENFNPDGVITVDLHLMEYNPTIYDDQNITQFTPAPNTGLGSPTVFGTVPAPTINNLLPNAVNPSFDVTVTTSTAGITQYAEVWYSAFSSPTDAQRIFAGTTAIQSSGTPYNPSTVMPVVTITNIPSGNWYFFSRMVNSVASSSFSPASSLLQWRPTTFQYSYRYLNVAYATDIVGTGFSLNPRGKTYYGLHNTSGTDISTTPADYTWYLAPYAFNTTGALIYLLYSNRTGRKFSFSSGFAAYAANTGSFVPTSTAIYDPSIWAGLPDGTNNIDLDQRTGQLIQTGTTSVGTGEIAVTNNSQGNIVASLQQYLDFGGAYTKTSTVAKLTIDIYGRVVGFETPDDFNYTQQVFTATSGQTVFSVTRGSTYISGQCWVMKNGLLLNATEYTDTGGATGTVTLSVGATVGEIITITSFKSVNTSTGVYASFTRNSATLTNQATYTASGFTLNTGFELLFLNGTLVNSQDYDISGQDITFIGNATGSLQIIQWSPNNLGVANGTPVNVDTFTAIGQTIYTFSYNTNAFNLFSNGVLFKQTIDYTTSTGTYTLSNTPTTNTIIMTQQTFARTGAV